MYLNVIIFGAKVPSYNRRDIKEDMTIKSKQSCCNGEMKLKCYVIIN